MKPYDQFLKEAQRLLETTWPAGMPLPEKDSLLYRTITEMMAAYASDQVFNEKRASELRNAFEDVQVGDGDLILVRPESDDPALTLTLARNVSKWSKQAGYDERGIVTLVVPKGVDIERMPRKKALEMLNHLTKRRRR